MSGTIEGSGPALALLSGGNIDASLMVQVIRARPRAERRYLVFRARSSPDRSRAKLLDLLAAEHVNVVEVEHKSARPWTSCRYTDMAETLPDARP